MRKKHIIIAAAAAAVLLMLSGSLFLLFHEKPEEAPTLNQVVEEKFNAYETDLRDSLGSMNSNTDVGNYLLTWAKNKQIAAVSDAAGNIIYNIPASENVSATRITRSAFLPVVGKFLVVSISFNCGIVKLFKESFAVEKTM